MEEKDRRGVRRRLAAKYNGVEGSQTGGLLLPVGGYQFAIRVRRYNVLEK